MPRKRVQIPAILVIAMLLSVSAWLTDTNLRFHGGGEWGPVCGALRGRMYHFGKWGIGVRLRNLGKKPLVVNDYTEIQLNLTAQPSEQGTDTCDEALLPGQRMIIQPGQTHQFPDGQSYYGAGWYHRATGQILVNGMHAVRFAPMWVHTVPGDYGWPIVIIVQVIGLVLLINRSWSGESGSGQHEVP